MLKTTTSILKSLLWLTALTLSLLGSSRIVAEETRSSAVSSSEDPEAIIGQACTQCHSLKPIMMMRDGLEGWTNTVHEMVLRGAQLNPDEAKHVVQYLVQNFGPGLNPMKTGILPPHSVVTGESDSALSDRVILPPGAGRDLVQGQCQLCHDLGRVVSHRRSKDEWTRIVEDMTTRGIPATYEQVQAMTAYLTSQFGGEQD